MSAPRIEDLSRLLNAIAAAARRPAELSRCFDELIACPDVFDGVTWLRGGYGGAAFVVAATWGCSGEAARSWMRWPLRRLFVEMQPARIGDPFGSGRQALAIPFSHGAERSVLIALVHEAACSEAYDAFFRAIESITVAALDSPSSDSSELPATTLEPSIIAFGLQDDLYHRLAAALGRRGWTAQEAGAFTEFTGLVRTSPPDVVAVDATRLHDCMAAVATIHRIANYGPLRLLAFGASAAQQLLSGGLIDCVLSTDASSEAIFRAIKQLALKSNALRRTFVAEEALSAQRAAASALSPQELADFAARQAAGMVNGWAACVLLNEYGAVFRAEYPPAPNPVLRKIPRPFVTGERLFQAMANEAFYDSVTDDVVERRALANLEPKMAASLALVSKAQRHCGAIVATSNQRRSDSLGFEALDRFANAVAARFEQLQPDKYALPELRKERLWERLRDRMLHLDIYRSSDCTIPWKYRIFDDAWGLLTLGIDDDSDMIRQLHLPKRRSGVPAAPDLRERGSDAACFAATIDFSTQTMHYSSSGFPPPLSFERSGLRASSRIIGTQTTGVAALQPDAGVVICDGALWNWLQRRDAPYERLATVLDREQPIGLASVVTLG
ncbi:MAG TPA: hypothetical protein VGF98_00965 [Candidatus Tumulicola sp.]